MLHFLMTAARKQGNHLAFGVQNESREEADPVEFRCKILQQRMADELHLHATLFE